MQSTEGQRDGAIVIVVVASIFFAISYFSSLFPSQISDIPFIWRIIRFREKSGRFQRVDDLMKIHGIKEKKFQKLKGYFCVDDITH
ncbi:MAG: ComEA family DNA-binding protein [Syntrophales bacterium]